MKHSLDWLVHRMIGYLFPLLENPLMPIVIFMQGQFNGLWEFEWRSRENEQQSRKRNGKEKIEKPPAGIQLVF